MRIYLDMCCLKRPFDDQMHSRIRLESEAVLALLALESDALEFVRSAPLLLENSANPVKVRAERVNQWLTAAAACALNHDTFKPRVDELMQMGFKAFDAIHVASAEEAGADFLGCCDDRFLAAARRNAARLKVRVVSVVDLAKEIVK